MVNDDKLKIADLAHSKRIFEDISVEYTDPKYLFDPVNYKLDMKSDIYSLGILLWELSSGYLPYSKSQQSCDQLKYKILDGLREEPVENTPIQYQQLYQKCWKEDPDQRPNIFEVFDQLKLDIGMFKLFTYLFRWFNINISQK